MIAALALGGVACNALAPTLRPVTGAGVPGAATGVTGGSGRRDPLTDGGGVASGRDSIGVGRPRDRASRPRSDGGRLDVRRVCRTSAFPRGYIAVGYESSASQCPLAAAGRADSVGTVAVLARYDNAPVGTRLDVCADQPIPGGWSPVSDEGPGDPGACPGATRQGDTVQRIVRNY